MIIFKYFLSIGKNIIGFSHLIFPVYIQSDIITNRECLKISSHNSSEQLVFSYICKKVENMSEIAEEAVIETLLDRFVNQRLPRAISIKEKVDRGEVLNDLDIQFLEEVFSSANKIKPLIDKHPEYETLAAKTINLYSEIMDKALHNEKHVKA